MTDIPSFQSTFLSIFSAGNLFYSLIMFITTLIAVTLLVVESVENSFLIPCVGSAIFSIIAGHIASAILGPVFQNKYIYAASILYILGLCITISKFRMKTLYTAIILCATLILCIPSFRDTIATEKSKNSRISATLESMQAVPSEAVILTDNGHFNWTILDYYVPENRHFLANTGYKDFKADEEYYLCWGKTLSDGENKWLSDNGYTAELVIPDGFLGDSDFLLYKLDRTS